MAHPKVDRSLGDGQVPFSGWETFSFRKGGWKKRQRNSPDETIFKIDFHSLLDESLLIRLAGTGSKASAESLRFTRAKGQMYLVIGRSDGECNGR